MINRFIGAKSSNTETTLDAGQEYCQLESKVPMEMEIVFDAYSDDWREHEDRQAFRYTSPTTGLEVRIVISHPTIRKWRHVNLGGRKFKRLR